MAKEKVQQEVNESNPVVIAVRPMKNEAVLRAEYSAKKAIENAVKHLQENNWDLTASAPYPRGYRYTTQERIQLHKHNFYTSITNTTKSGYQISGPCFVELDDEKVQKYVEKCKSEAAQQYEDFVFKLDRKIGVCKSARLLGDHVWSYSFLEVTRHDGSVEYWKTQQIVNVSSLGTPFNQWPTRKLKNPPILEIQDYAKSQDGNG